MYIINKYDLNGKHTLLDWFTNEIKMFNTYKEAVYFCNELGIDVDDVCIEEPTQADLNDEYFPSEVL